MGSVVEALGLKSTGSVIVAHGLSSSMAGGNLSGPGMKPVSPALASELFTTEPPGKPLTILGTSCKCNHTAFVFL